MTEPIPPKMRNVKMVTLYHFTSELHLPLILEGGSLYTTESNISLRKPHAGPDVVWLTTHQAADARHGLHHSFVDKTRIRFTVSFRARDVHKWRPWARSHGVDPRWLDALAVSGGSSSWRVCTHPIDECDWVEIRDMVTGQVIDDNEYMEGSAREIGRTGRTPYLCRYEYTQAPLAITAGQPVLGTR